MLHSILSILYCLSSLSARRAWIEIFQCLFECPVLSVALRKESVDRNIGWLSVAIPWRTSLSARRAWIEIPPGGLYTAKARVALRKESVDRNSTEEQEALREEVALRKESVDRNTISGLYKGANMVALRKESVDRNGALPLSGPRAHCRSPQGERG